MRQSRKRADVLKKQVISQSATQADGNFFLLKDGLFLFFPATFKKGNNFFYYF